MNPGERHGPYELLTRLGAGGMGEVWKARDTRLDRVVAIKFSKAQFSERFQREVKAIAALNHPNIATLFDTGPDYLVMEYVEGAPVRPLPDDSRKLLDQAAQIADGLAAAHSASFVHRDLKPDNILVTREGRIKILDFGLAKQTAPTTNEATVTMTQPGMIVGTMAYMSPEQASGKDVDARSDQFSLGLILYEMATGQRAFQRDTAPELLAAIIRDDPAPLPDKLPVPLRWIIERCLHKDPHERYDSTRDLYHDLRVARERTGITSAAVAAAKPARTWRSWLWPALATASLALAMAVTMAALWTSDEAPRYRFTPFAITDENEFEPIWSPDGKSIAYQISDGQGRRRLLVKGLAGGVPVTLVRDRVFFSLSWSPDSERIYYQDRTEPPGFVAWVSRAGGDPVRLDMDGGTPVVSPDGKHLAVFLQERKAGGKSVRRLALSTPPGAKPKALGPELACCVTPPAITWLPDGKSVLAQNLLQDGTREMVEIFLDGRARPRASTPGVMVHPLSGNRWAVAKSFRLWGPDQGLMYFHLDSGETRPLLPSGVPLTDPAISADGRRLAYASQTHGLGLEEVHLEDCRQNWLVPNHIDQHSPAWSPAGNELAFFRQNDIVIRDRAGTNERVLEVLKDLPKPGGIVQLSWLSYSPDGRRLVFTCSGCEPGLSLWTVPAGGGAPARLAPGDSAGGYAASFSPDGQWLVFVHTRLAQETVLAKLRVGSGEKPVILGPQCGQPAWSPRGDTIACRSKEGIRLLSADGVQQRAVPGGNGPFVWTGDGKGILTVQAENGRDGIFQTDVLTGQRRNVCPVAFRGTNLSTGYRLALSPDGKSLASSVLQQDGDIWIVDGFEAPRSGWERLWR